MQSSVIFTLLFLSLFCLSTAKPLILAYTFAGDLVCIDGYGQKIWTYSTYKPPLQSCSPGISQSRILPGSDGSLYLYSPSGTLSKVPISLSNLTSFSPFSTDSGKTLVLSSQTTDVFHLDLLTGSSNFHLPLHDFSRHSNLIESSSKSNSVGFPLSSPLHLLSSLTTTTISVLNSLQSTLLWNVSQGLVHFPNTISISCSPTLSPLFPSTVDQDLYHSFAFLLCHLSAGVDGSLSLKIGKQQRWKVELNSPISQLFIIPDCELIGDDNSDLVVLSLADPINYSINQSNCRVDQKSSSVYLEEISLDFSSSFVVLSMKQSCPIYHTTPSILPIPGVYPVEGLNGNLAFDISPPALPPGTPSSTPSATPSSNDYPVFSLFNQGIITSLFIICFAFIVIFKVFVDKSPSSSSPSLNTITTFEDKDHVLGHGSCGTIVYEGRLLDGRKVAVKRLVSHYSQLARTEISNLCESDSHPNIVSYYTFMEKGGFIYLALEKCAANLVTFLTTKQNDLTLRQRIDLCFDVINGLSHLHLLNIVHRDIKPSNILVNSFNFPVTAKISDMGLSRTVQADQHFLTEHGHNGSEGWKSPEVLRINHNSELGGKHRLSKAVDVFAFGCLVHYILSQGHHPFGSKLERDSNILNGKFKILADLPVLAQDLIFSCLKSDPNQRPSASQLSNHPLFWTDDVILSFLIDVSDRVESEPAEHPLVISLEATCRKVVGSTGWMALFDSTFLAELGKHRKYNSNSVRDLLRVVRNKKNHYRDLSHELRQYLGPLPSGYLNYFTSRFPKLVMCCVVFLRSNQCLHSEEVFQKYLCR
ncbi:hypothetical protein RCL1_007235 [Eukaryota sp. TZLM3-RCL]